MEYAAESRDTELVEELANWFLKKVLNKLYIAFPNVVSRNYIWKRNFMDFLNWRHFYEF